MIKKVTIENLKCIKHESLDFKPLTIITGLNSTGKSTVLQSVLIQNKRNTKNGAIYLDELDDNFSTIRNKYTRKDNISINVELDEVNLTTTISEGICSSDSNLGLEGFKVLDIEKNLYYLSANRLGPEEFSKVSTSAKIGINGEHIFGTFEQEKSNPVIDELIKYTESITLKGQVNYWLSKFTGVNFILNSSKQTEKSTRISYDTDGLSDISPFQLGTGVSYLVKILIMCLRAKKNDVLIIENPEIHLHPAAQAMLGEFFSFIVAAGIQVILETHCEHLINKVQYQVYKKQIKKEDVIIYYKQNIHSNFEEIKLNDNGQYTTDFPDGFFDATLDNLLEME